MKMLGNVSDDVVTLLRRFHRSQGAQLVGDVA